MRNVVKTILIVILLLSYWQNNFYSQTVTSESYQTYFGYQNDDIGYKIIESKTGGYFVVGQTTREDNNITDIYLAKLEKMASPEWVKSYGGSGIDIGKSIIELSDSGLVILGHTTSFGAGGYDVIVIRTNKKGDIIWQKTLGGLEWEFATSFCKTNDDHLMICGYTYSNQSTGIDPFVTKLSMSGDELWTKIFTGSKDDFLNDIIEIPGNKFVVVGTAKSYGDATGDVWLMKLNALGDTLQTKRWGGDKAEIGNAIVSDAGGDLLIVGGTASNPSANGNALILKADVSFSVHWSRDYGTPDKNEVALDVLNSSSSYGSMLMLYTTEEVPSNGRDVKNILLNSGGYYLRGGSKGGSKDDECFAMCNTKDKGYIACGYTESFTANLKDIYVIKYDSEMTIGPVILSTRKPYKNYTPEIRLYPTVVVDNYILLESLLFEHCPEITITNGFGQFIRPEEIEPIDLHTYKINLPPNFKGPFIVNVGNGLFVKKCIAH